MKNILLALTLFINFNIYAQILPIDSTTKQISYTKVIEVPGTTKIDLYSRANEWFAKTYNSSQNVLQAQDKEEGKLIGKALMKSTLKGFNAGYVNYTISVFLKDNRYKYEVTDLAHEKGTSTLGSGGALESNKAATMSIMGKQWVSIKIQADNEIKSLLSSLELAMNQKSKNDF